MADPAPQLVSFDSGSTTLRGFLHRPSGPGPFPAVIWNHGSERLPGAADELGRFYTSAGYVCFVPHRHGHGRSPGDYPIAALRARAQAEANGVPGGGRQAIHWVIELHERYLEDTIAAVRWLERQSFVDACRIAMSGVSHGGAQTLLAAEAGAGARAFVPFAPAAMAWKGNPELHDRLLRAVRAAREPIFLIQAANDYDLGPSEILGAALARKGEPNRSRVYPPYGDGPQAGHGDFACHGTGVWGDDVRAFLSEALTPAAVRWHVTP